MNLSSSSSSGIEDQNEEEFHATKRDRKSKLLKLPSVALACDRTGTSDRVASMIASATLTDAGIINESDKSKVIDRSKVRRERSF